MENNTSLMTVKEMAAAYGVHPVAMSTIVRIHKLIPKKVPRCPNGKGFDDADQAVIRRALGIDEAAPKRRGSRPARSA